PSLAWSHRKSPAPSPRARRITACDSRESSKSICKEIALQRRKTGKFDYLSGPNYPAHSIAFKFFTDDFLLKKKPARTDGLAKVSELDHPHLSALATKMHPHVAERA